MVLLTINFELYLGKNFCYSGIRYKFLILCYTGSGVGGRKYPNQFLTAKGRAPKFCDDEQTILCVKVLLPDQCLFSFRVTS